MLTQMSFQNHFAMLQSQVHVSNIYALMGAVCILIYALSQKLASKTAHFPMRIGDTKLHTEISARIAELNQGQFAIHFDERNIMVPLVKLCAFKTDAFLGCFSTKIELNGLRAFFDITRISASKSFFIIKSFHRPIIFVMLVLQPIAV